MTCKLESHSEFTLVWRLYSASGVRTSAFVPALDHPAPEVASSADVAKIAEWLDGAF